MSEYSIPEGKFILPSRFFQDVSLTMLKFPQLGTGLTIARSELVPGKNAVETYLKQLGEVKKSKSRFMIHEQNLIDFGKGGLISGVECVTQFSQGETIVHQYQFAGELDGKMLVLCYTKSSSFSPQDRTHWMQIKSSFEPKE